MSAPFSAKQPCDGLRDKKRKTYSAFCLQCGKQVRLRPAGGDWLNDVYPIRHNNKQGKRCDGHLYAIDHKKWIEPEGGAS